MASSFINVCRFNPTLGGTTDWTYSSAVTGYQSPTAAGAGNGVIYSYRAESADLSQWEVGFGAYNSGTGVFARTTVLFNSAGTTAKINFSTVPQVAIVALAEDLVFREKLIAARTYYVRTDGSDSNNGLANTAGGAFLTINKALAVITTLDLNSYTATVSVAAGTYAGAITQAVPFVGLGTVQVTGDTTTPSNVVIQGGIQLSNAAVLSIGGFKTTTSFQGISVTSNAILNVTGKMEYGAAGGQHLLVTYGGAVVISADYTISGGAAIHWLCKQGGRVVCVGRTITLTGTPAFSSMFAYATQGAAVMEVYGNTFSGSATGVRYTTEYAAGIITGGGGANYLPGNSAGTATSPGWYQ